MNRYQFVNIADPPKNKATLRTSFGGVCFDDKYIGEFVTLSVTGRGILPQRVRSTEKTGGDGSWLDNISLPERLIDVEALLVCDDIYQVLQSLGNDLNKGTQRLIFSDDGEYYYNAIFTGYSRQKEDSNTAIVTLSFTCLDPFKYGTRLITASGKGSTSLHRICNNEYLINKITVKDSKTVNMQITNDRSGQRITLTSVQIAGDTVFDFQRMAITVNGQNLLPCLDIYSDFERFEILGTDVVSVVPQDYTIIIEARERAL